MTANAAETFDAFVRARQGQLVQFGWALTGDRGLGEDLVQIALQRLWPHWSRVSASAEPLAYTHKIMVNLATTWRGRRWRHVAALSVGEEPAPSADPSDDVVGRHVVDAWLAALPPRQRAVVVLRFLLDLSVEETAHRLGTSSGTVKSQCSRALDKLRAVICARDEVEEGSAGHARH